ncbi:hypothetical protein ANO11243_080290 [Dothideomycetidae sp. 11243]|nr:hypothetical protein ANO11243_080290 [fungal sp. No.11243]
MIDTQYVPTEEGKIPFHIPSIDKECFTFYKIFGDLKSGATPLVFLHGGPGAGHDAFLPFAALWETHGIPLVMYDQIGCGQSTWLNETLGNEELGQESLFLAELDNLLDYLHLRDGPGYHLLGHSFGGMIGPAFAATRPLGLRKLILASGVASKETCNQSFDILRSRLPDEHRDALLEAERSEDFQSVGFQEAWKYILRHYMCRTENQPQVFLDGIKSIAEATAVIGTLFGSCPMFNYGTFKNWTCVPRLHLIEAPTLIFNCEFDTSPLDVAQQPFFDLIPKVRWHKFSRAGHLPWLESERLLEDVLKLVGGFLVPSKVIREEQH